MSARTPADDAGEAERLRSELDKANADWKRIADIAHDERDEARAEADRLRVTLQEGAEKVATLLCERHQAAGPTRQPCAACVQDAYAATGADPLWMAPADPVSLADVDEANS